MRSIFIFLSFLLYAAALAAQPEPCGDNPQLTSFCDQACTLCDLNGFNGINDLTASGQGFPEFCTIDYDKMSFIGFYAGTEDLTIQVTVGTCSGGLGSLEVGFFQTEDCQNFEAITFCDTDIESGEIVTYTNYEPLTIGQHYYLVMDGSSGATCAWSCTVIEGSTNFCDPLDSVTEDNSSDAIIEVYPNPSHDRFSISSNELHILSLDIINMNGKKIPQTVNIDFEMSLDLTGYPAGLYFVRVHTDQGNVVKKILLQ